MDRTGACRNPGRPAVRPAGPAAIHLLLPSPPGRGERPESAPDGGDRPNLHREALLRIALDQLGVDGWGLDGQRETGGASCARGACRPSLPAFTRAGGIRRVRSTPAFSRAFWGVKPNEVWCADVSDIPMSPGVLDLVAILDAYSRYVTAWELSNSLEAAFCVAARGCFTGPVRRSSTQTRGRSSPARPLPAGSGPPESESAWMAGAGRGTTFASNDSGRSRRCTRQTTGKGRRPAAGGAVPLPFTTAGASTCCWGGRTPAGVYSEGPGILLLQKDRTVNLAVNSIVL